MASDARYPGSLTNVTGYEFGLGILVDGPLQIDSAGVCGVQCSALRLQADETGFVLFVPPGVTSGLHSLSVTLPDGTKLLSNVNVGGPTPTAATPAALRLIRVVPNDSRYPGTTTNVTGYEYGLGIIIDGPIQVQAPCIPQCSWVRSDTTETVVIFFVPPSIPPGTYSLTVLLPSGARLTGSISR